MALKNSARWLKKERKIASVLASVPHVKEPVYTDGEREFSAQDLAEEVRRDSSQAREAVDAFF
ncbi:MAG: hypothetical protein WCV62_05135 [Candidatus Peribacteraceae bacterium]|jgi:hypothetical protein